MHHFEQSKHKIAHLRQNIPVATAYPCILSTKYRDLQAKYKEGDKTSSIVTDKINLIHPFVCQFSQQNAIKTVLACSQQ